MLYWICLDNYKILFNHNSSLTTECSGLDTTWKNIIADQDFPVVEGTVLSLSCEGGEEVTGDNTVTCVKDTQFNFSEEPKCCEYDVLTISVLYNK